MLDTPALSLSDVPVPSVTGERKVSLAVRAGHIGCLVEQEINGLVCMSYLAGLRTPDEGDVSVNGHLPNQYASRAVLVRGGRRLCSALTVGEHLALIDRCRLDEVLDDFGLAPLLELSDCPISTLPIQLCQELEVALAILSGAGSLLLHRPFESLLGYERRRLLSLLRTFVGKGGACLYTTRYRRLARYAETVFLGSFAQKEGQEEKAEANATLSSFEHAAEPSPGRVVGILARSVEATELVHTWFLERTEGCGRGVNVLFNPQGEFCGLSPNLTLAEHTSHLFADTNLSSWGHVRSDSLKNCVEELLSSFDIRDLKAEYYPEEVPSSLRARLALVLQLGRMPTTLYAHFPCQGVQSNLPVSERDTIVNLLKDYAQSGGAVVLCSNDLELLSSICHEVRCASGDVEGREVMVRGVFRRMLA